MNERGKNHDSLWSIPDGHGDKTRDRCYEARKDYKSAEYEAMDLVLFT